MDLSKLFKVENNIVYAESVKEMNISRVEVDALHDVVRSNISGDFGLIEIRAARISIDPMIYFYAKELMPQFTAFALVAESDLTFQYFKLEEACMEGIQVGVFHTLAEAESWMEKVLSDEERLK